MIKYGKNVMKSIVMPRRDLVPSVYLCDEMMDDLARVTCLTDLAVFNISKVADEINTGRTHSKLCKPCMQQGNWY